jgi:hypothetical protein
MTIIKLLTIYYIVLKKLNYYCTLKNSFITKPPPYIMKLLIKKLLLSSLIIVALQNKAICQVREVLDALKPTKAFEGTPILKKGSHVIQAGIGMGSNILSLVESGQIGDVLNTAGVSSSTSRVGPITIGYEYLVKDNLGMGLSVSYAEASQTFNVNSTNSASIISIPGIGNIPGIGSILGTSGTTGALNTNVKSTTILLSTTYHLYTTDKFDPYSKVSIGATFWSGSNKNASGSDAGSAPTFPTPIAYNAVLGLRYFAAKQMGLYGELSYSNLRFAANIGLTFKLH